METVMISEIKGMLVEAKMEIDLVLDALENKIILFGQTKERKKT